MLLNYPDLINAIESGESFEYLFFYGHHPKSAQAIDNSCFSQWYDDGIGFEMGTVKKGIGLKSILSRVEFYGGEVKINTNPGTGFEVFIKLPFE